ncbi:MAG TPA: M28 family peptidase [Candidatus Thermoplasmatota archaeon]|nr:M28 family peptidase [Candidatus Thermoplasmatota archaeon]
MGEKKATCKTLCIMLFLVLASCVPGIYGAAKQNVSPESTNKASVTVDVQYIYNITKALSNIVFTSYDEAQGQIAKGRAFGTVGEHAAAKILYDNMSMLGLHPQLEQMQRRPGVPHDDLITELEVQNYQVKLNGRALDCFIYPSWKGPHGSPSEVNTTFSYQGLHVRPIPTHPCVYNRTIAQDSNDFVFLGRDQWNDPNGVLPVVDLLKPYMNPLKFYIVFHVTSLFNILRETAFWYLMYPHCKALILQDFHPDCHDFVFIPKDSDSIPIIFITGNDGDQMRADFMGSRVDFNLTQHLNTSVISYNVIGEIPGRDPTKSVIVSCLYDGWWNQATGDAAIGMAMVLGIAKYFVQARITPQYTLKFIAFGGEEYDVLGAKYYVATHKNESIVALIDLNQLGFTQNDPRLTLDFVANKALYLKKVWGIVQRTDYQQRTENVTGIKAIWWPSGEIPGNALPFAQDLHCNAMSIFKDGGWTLHHRDGVNHTAGDVLSYFNWTDTLVTTEIITNITLAFATGNPDIAATPLIPLVDGLGFFNEAQKTRLPR